MIGPEIDRVVGDEIEGFLRRSLAGLFVAAEAADREVKSEHDPIEAVNVHGYVLRSKFETNFRQAAQLSKLKAEVVCAEHTSWTHTEVHSRTLIVTANRVESPGAMVHGADFRRTLAGTGQLELLASSEPPADALFAIFTYTRSSWPARDDQQKWGHLPGSAHLAFPATGLKFWLHQIDLFQRYSDVVRANTPTEWDDVQLRLFINRGRRTA